MKAMCINANKEFVWPAFEARAFAPFVHKVLPLQEAAAGHAILERGENCGKVVLVL